VIVALLVIVGCDYQVPLTEEHNISIDPSVLGICAIEHGVRS